MINLDEQLNSKSNIVYSICETKIKQFYDLVDFYSTKSKFIEIRLDYMLSQGMHLEFLINLLNIIKDNYKDNLFFATLKTREDGGFLDTTPSKYFAIIKKIYQNSNVDFLDIKYSYYVQDRNVYENLFTSSYANKALIITYYDKSQFFNDDNYEQILDDMLSLNSFQIISINNYAHNKNLLYKLMQFGAFYKSKIKKAGKYAFFTSQGKIGVLSRVWNDFTNSKFVFVDTVDIINNEVYPLSYEKYTYLRRIIHK